MPLPSPTSVDHPLARLLVVLAATLVALLGTAASVGAAPDAKAPAPDTIVKVTGNAAEGFGIEHYDGSSTFPPTHSEALAECQEYSAKVGMQWCLAVRFESVA